MGGGGDSAVALTGNNPRSQEVSPFQNSAPVLASATSACVPRSAVQKTFSPTAYCFSFFLSCVGCIAGLRAVDALLPVDGEPLLQAYWAGMLQRWPWLLSHVAFSGLVGIVSFIISCVGFTVMDVRRSYDTKLQKHYWPSMPDLLRAAVPQVAIYVIANYLGYVYGYRAAELPALAPRLPVFAEQASPTRQNEAPLAPLPPTRQLSQQPSSLGASPSSPTRPAASSQVITAFIVGDFFIYWEHRIMHAVPYLRKNIHSWHHAYTAPFSWAGGVHLGKPLPRQPFGRRPSGLSPEAHLWPARVLLPPIPIPRGADPSRPDPAGVVHPLEDVVVILCQMTFPLLCGHHPLATWVFVALWVLLLVEEHSGHDVSGHPKPPASPPQHPKTPASPPQHPKAPSSSLAAAAPRSPRLSLHSLLRVSRSHGLHIIGCLLLGAPWAAVPHLTTSITTRSTRITPLSCVSGIICSVLLSRCASPHPPPPLPIPHSSAPPPNHAHSLPLT